MKKIYFKTIAAVLCLAWPLSGMAETTATNDYMYIEDFQIKPGDTRLVDVWINSSIPFMHILYGKVVLPDGLEMVSLDPEEIDPELFIYDKNEFGEYAALSVNFSNYELMTGPFADEFIIFNMKTSHYVWTYDVTDRQFNFDLVTCDKIEIMGNGQYQLFQFKVKASEDFTGGMIEVCPDGYEFISYWGFTSHEGGSSETETHCSGQPSRSRVMPLGSVAIEDVKAASTGESRYYDLQGRALKGEPATPGIYVKDGHKVLVK